MPDFPIVDSHMHFWDPRMLRYPWLEGVPPLNRPFLPGDFDAGRGDVDVERIVFVQAEADRGQFREETEWVSSLARGDRRICGIVAWAPLENGAEAEADLASLAENPLIKGIRRIIQFETDEDFCIQPDFVRGVRLLSRFGWSFDLGVGHIHLPNAARLARQCPEVRFVLDHLGKPDVRHRIIKPWREHVKALSDLPNVWCKLSGLATEADHEAWKPDDLKPYLDKALECFGFDRVMFGGDWPVATQATGYSRWVETLQWAVAGCGDGNLRKLFRDNAVSFYRL
jgi:L-fuconolactonase